MANIDNVQLPDGSSYNIVDNTSGFASQSYVDSAVSSITKTTIGLGNVDNTSDLNKPISTATQTALDTLDEDKADKTDIAPAESSSTASQTYQIGDKFYYNGLLYKATAVINSGGTITPNGNCSLAGSIVEQIGLKIQKINISVIPTANSGVSPFSYYASGNFGLPAGATMVAMLVTPYGGSSQRTIVNKIPNQADGFYLYSTSNETVGVSCLYTI